MPITGIKDPKIKQLMAAAVARDGVINKQDAAKIQEAAEDDGGRTREERADLEILLSSASNFDPVARKNLTESLKYDRDLFKYKDQWKELPEVDDSKVFSHGIISHPREEAALARTEEVMSKLERQPPHAQLVSLLGEVCEMRFIEGVRVDALKVVLASQFSEAEKAEWTNRLSLTLTDADAPAFVEQVWEYATSHPAVIDQLQCIPRIVEWVIPSPARKIDEPRSALREFFVSKLWSGAADEKTVNVWLSPVQKEELFNWYTTAVKAGNLESHSYTRVGDLLFALNLGKPTADEPEKLYERIRASVNYDFLRNGGGRSFGLHNLALASMIQILDKYVNAKLEKAGNLPETEAEKLFEVLVYGMTATNAQAAILGIGGIGGEPRVGGAGSVDPLFRKVAKGLPAATIDRVLSRVVKEPAMRADHSAPLLFDALKAAGVSTARVKKFDEDWQAYESTWKQVPLNHFRELWDAFAADPSRPVTDFQRIAAG
jgi:hypothetical protein